MPSLWKNRLRSSLVAAMLALVFIFGCKKNRARSKVTPNRWVSVSLSDGQDNATVGLTERDFNEIIATLPTIERAVPERHSITGITYGTQTRKTRVCATLVDMRHLLADARTEIADGRFFDLEDRKSGLPVIVISQPLARDLFPGESAINKSVSLGEHEFKVVGVVGQSRGSLIKMDVADVYIDLNPFLQPATIQPVPGGGNNPPSEPLDRIWVKVSDLSNVGSTTSIVEQLLKRNHPDAQYSIGPEHEAHLDKDAPK